MPHGQPRPEEAQEGVRLAEELAGAAGDAVADEEPAGEQPGMRPSPPGLRQQQHDDEQAHAFQKGLVEFAREAGGEIDARIDHGEGPAGWRRATPEFAIDEIGYSAEAEADRRHDRDAVSEAENVDPVPEAEPGDGNGDAQHPAVEAHAALPDGDDAQRMLEEGTGLVEQHVADSSAQNDAERRPGQEIIHLQRRGDGGRPLRDPAHQPPAEHEPGDVGDRIPMDCEGAELDQDRVEVRENERLHRVMPRPQ